MIFKKFVLNRNGYRSDQVQAKSVLRFVTKMADESPKWHLDDFTGRKWRVWT